MEGYSEMGRRPEKSQFSLTCSLLSQYIKEKGCPADLSFGMPTRAFDPSAIEAYRPQTTMRLLPGVDFVGDENAGGIKDDAVGRNSMGSMKQCPPQLTGSVPAAKILPEKAQLTIFYGGKVLVIDDFPAEKAEDLMQLARKGSIPASGVQNFSFSPPTPTTDQPICPSPVNLPVNFPPLPRNFTDPPMARKASLHRFLEKRRERINAKTPYQLSSSEGSTTSSVSAKQEEKNRQPWLGLGTRILNSSM